MACCSVIAFKDNSSAIRGFNVKPLLPVHPGKTSPLAPQDRDWDLLLTAETHNFPCAVAPYPGEPSLGVPTMLCRLASTLNVSPYYLWAPCSACACMKVLHTVSGCIRRPVSGWLDSPHEGRPRMRSPTGMLFCDVPGRRHRPTHYKRPATIYISHLNTSLPMHCPKVLCTCHLDTPAAAAGVK